MYGYFKGVRNWKNPKNLGCTFISGVYGTKKTQKFQGCTFISEGTFITDTIVVYDEKSYVVVVVVVVVVLLKKNGSF